MLVLRERTLSGVGQIYVTNTLNSALAITLSQCQTLFGVVRKEEGQVKIIRSRGNSIPFPVKQLDLNERSLSFDDLQAAGFPPLEINKEVVLEDKGNSGMASMIEHWKNLCGFQITRILGGMILSISYHHYCIDGSSFSQYFRQWAKNALALSIPGASTVRSSHQRIEGK